MRRTRGSLVTLVVALLVVISLTASPSNAMTLVRHQDLASVIMSQNVPLARAAHHTVPQALRHLVGTTVVNNRLSAKTKIVGWVKHQRKGKFVGWSPKVTTYKLVHCSGHVVARGAAPMGAHCPPARMAGVRPVTMVIPTTIYTGSSHWWNPVSWSWKDVMSVSWRKVVRPCAAGTLSSVVGVKSTQLSLKILLKGRGSYIAKHAAEREAFGPDAVPVLALSGCMFGLVSQFWQ